MIEANYRPGRRRNPTTGIEREQQQKEAATPETPKGLENMKNNIHSELTLAALPSDRTCVGGTVEIASGLKPKLQISLVAGLAGFFTVVNTGPAQVWQPTTAPRLPWTAVAASADFRRLVAVAWPDNDFGLGGFPIYTSSDSGATWVPTGSPLVPWTAVASSADGMKLVAVAGGPYRLIVTSADAGTNWVVTSAPSNAWGAVASSGDGTRLVAAGSAPTRSGVIYTSPDSGATWQLSDGPSNNVFSLAASADGTTVFGAAADVLYKSSDSGATWLPCNFFSCSSVACSADGSKVMASAPDGSILCSADSGASWSKTMAPTSFGGASVACSADGTMLAVATVDTNNVAWLYTSTNLGATWATDDVPFGLPSVLALSADGQKIMGAGPADGNAYFGALVWTAPYAGPWRLALQTTPPLKDWQGWAAVAASADGTKLAAVPGYGAVYTSPDSGNTWSQTSSPTNNWYGVVSSADGVNLVALGSVPDMVVCASSDSGATWVRIFLPTNSNYCVSIACSADTRKLITASTSGGIYTSSDSGRTWIQTGAPSQNWTGVASSADGTRLAASASVTCGVCPLGGIYISADSGVTWNRTSAPSNLWSSIASSADGSRLAAVGVDTNRNAFIYVSSDAGATWRQAGAPSNFLAWQSVASSADGTTLVAIAAPIYDFVANCTMIYISKDFGVTWTQADAPALNWAVVASSANGSNIVALGGFDIGIGGLGLHFEGILDGVRKLAVSGHLNVRYSERSASLPEIREQRIEKIDRKPHQTRIATEVSYASTLEGNGSSGVGTFFPSMRFAQCNQGFAF